MHQSEFFQESKFLRHHLIISGIKMNWETKLIGTIVVKASKWFAQNGLGHQIGVGIKYILALQCFDIKVIYKT